MKGIIVFFLVTVLAGCSTTVPVKPKFPESVPTLMEPCPELKQTPVETTKLSEVISVVALNYGQYHLCKSKVEAWIEWYNEQKKIYKEIK